MEEGIAGKRGRGGEEGGEFPILLITDPNLRTIVGNIQHPSQSQVKTRAGIILSTASCRHFQLVLLLIIICSDEERNISRKRSRNELKQIELKQIELKQQFQGINYELIDDTFASLITEESIKKMYEQNKLLNCCTQRIYKFERMGDHGLEMGDHPGLLDLKLGHKFYDCVIFPLVMHYIEPKIIIHYFTIIIDKSGKIYFVNSYGSDNVHITPFFVSPDDPKKFIKDFDVFLSVIKLNPRSEEQNKFMLWFINTYFFSEVAGIPIYPSDEQSDDGGMDRSKKIKVTEGIEMEGKFILRASSCGISLITNVEHLIQKKAYRLLNPEILVATLSTDGDGDDADYPMDDDDDGYGEVLPNVQDLSEYVSGESYASVFSSGKASAFASAAVEEGGGKRKRKRKTRKTKKRKTRKTRRRKTKKTKRRRSTRK